MSVRRKEEIDHKDFENKLPNLGYADDDIRCQLIGTAKSSIQYILDILENQYRRDHGLKVLPESLWIPLKRKAYLHYAQHCERLAKELKKASTNPNIKF